MNDATASRLDVKHPEHSLQQRLEQQVGLSPVQGKAALEIFLDWAGKTYTDCRPVGQIVRTAVAFEELAGKPVKDCRTVEVNLTLDHRHDDVIHRQHGTVALRKAKVFRLCWEAYEQGGLLSHEDLSSVLALDRSTIGRLVAQLQQEQLDVPTRGAVHDMGRAPSHKQPIGRLLCRGYLYTEITALTSHTESSIERYALQLGQVVALADAGAAKNDIRIICDLSEQAVEIYLTLYREHNTDEFRPHLDRLKRRFEASSGVKGSGYPRPARATKSSIERLRDNDFEQAVSVALQQDLELTAPVADLVASRVGTLAQKSFPQQTTLSPGQTVLLVDSADSAPKVSGQPTTTRPLVPVTLSVWTDDKLAIWDSKDSMRDKRARVADALAREAQEQGGTMTVSLLALLLGLSPAVMAEALSHLRRTQKRPTPIKGITEDAGATLTHKEQICELQDVGHTPPEISVIALHAPDSRDRYLKTNLQVETLIKVLQCIPDEVTASRFLGVRRSVVKQYLERLRRKREAELPQSTATASTDPQ